MARVLRPRTAPRGHRGWRGSVSRPGGFPVGHHRRRLRVRIPAGDAPSIPDEGRDALLRRAILAVDMAHIMGGPEEILQRFGRAVESVLREGRATIDADQPPADVGLLIPELLPSAKAPKLDPEHLLERAEGLTRKEFKRRYFNEDKPVALGNVGASRAGAPQWADLVARARTRTSKHSARDWRVRRCRELARGGDAYRAVPWTNTSRPDWSASWRSPRQRRRRGRGGGCGGRRCGTPAKNVAYLAQHQLFEQLPSLLSVRLRPLRRVLHHGGRAAGERLGGNRRYGDAVLPADSCDNLLGQVAGFKFVRLYAESDSPFVSIRGGVGGESFVARGGRRRGGASTWRRRAGARGRARAGAGIGRGGETHRGTSVRWTWSIRTWRSFRSSRRRGTWT